MIETMDRDELTELSKINSELEQNIELEKRYHARERDLKIMQKKINRRGLDKQREYDPDAEGYDLWQDGKGGKYGNLKVELSKKEVMVDLRPHLSIGEPKPEARHDFDPSFDEYVTKINPP